MYNMCIVIITYSAYIKTPLIDSTMNDDAQKYLASLHAVKRLGRPEEIGDFCAFLGSDMSKFMTGTYYPVDGGFLAQ